MDNKDVVVLGSARKGSDTRKLLEALFPSGTVKFLDLLAYKVYPYSYSGQYPADDQFLQVMELILQHQRVLFATPVYWYAMSGLMKTFLDRLTDVVTIQKELGRQLAGKETFLIAVGADKELPLGFEKPFELTSDYFDMKYTASYYCSVNALQKNTGSREAFWRAMNRTKTF